MALGDPAEKARRWNIGAMFCSAIVGALAVSIFHETRFRIAWDLKTTDLITLLMAGAGLILTAVGIFVAILAFWGWGTIRRDSISAAQKAAEKCVNKYTASEEFSRKIEDAVIKFLQRNLIEQNTLLPLLLEKARSQKAMSEVDEAEVDDAWANVAPEEGE